MKNQVYKVELNEQGEYAATISCNDELVCRFPQTMQNANMIAIGQAIVFALQSKNDFGNKASVIIDGAVCSIDSPVIKI